MATASLPEGLLREALLSGANDRSVIRSIRRVGGGDISVAARVETEEWVYFAKWQPDAPDHGKSMFHAEAEGLTQLRQVDSGLVIPLVCGQVTSDQGALLLLEWLEAGSQSTTVAATLGEGLARQHRHVAEAYGLDHDNFLG
ncbi:MAG: fructosamine kinase family protein, partial [Chloroflexota bacterium]|nr:fructosamine kinase family protein [Chloroflexota bacterium]